MFKSFNFMKLLAAMLLVSAFLLNNTTESRARTTSVVAFNSEYGLVLIDSIRSRAAFDLFESLNVPIKYGFYYQTKIFAPKDKSFRIACTAWGANHVCAVIVYPGKFATLDFDTDEIRLNLPAEIARKYEGKFPQKDGSFHLETEDKRLIIDWSVKGLKIKNFRFKGDHQRPKRLENYTLPHVPGIDL